MKSKEHKLLKIKQGLNKETQKIINFKQKSQSLEHLKTQKAHYQVGKTCVRRFQEPINKITKYLSKEKDNK